MTGEPAQTARKRFGLLFAMIAAVCAARSAVTGFRLLREKQTVEIFQLKGFALARLAASAI